jgi:hypothetical protein
MDQNEIIPIPPQEAGTNSSWKLTTPIAAANQAGCTDLPAGIDPRGIVSDQFQVSRTRKP